MSRKLTWAVGVAVVLVLGAVLAHRHLAPVDPVRGGAAAVLSMSFDRASLLGPNERLGDDRPGSRPEWVSDGRIGGAYRFDGGDFIAVEDIELMTWRPDDVITASAWIKSDVTDYRAKHVAIFDKRFEFFFGITDEDDFTVGSFGANIDRASCGSVDTDWHYLVWILDEGRGAAEIWRDGRLLCSGELSDRSLRTSHPLTIGGFSWTGGQFEGLVDEVRITTHRPTPRRIFLDYVTQRMKGAWDRFRRIRSGGADASEKTRH